MAKSKVSIAICTHNGERFLKEQLESFLNQSVMADEIIAYDDASKDKTLQILKEFAEKSPIKTSIFQNIPAVGVTKNFENAINACSGELVFFSDQDDIWLPNKVEKMTQEMEKNPNLGILFSNAFRVNDQLEKLEKTQFDILLFRKEQKDYWKKNGGIAAMLNGNRVTGCTVLVRKSFAQNAMPFPLKIKEIMHDSWLAWVGITENKIDFIDECFTLYRQHAFQVVGTAEVDRGRTLTFKERMARPRAEKIIPIKNEYLDLKEIADYLAIKRTLPKLMKEKLDFLKMRSELPENRLLRIPKMIPFLATYFKFKKQEANFKGPYLTIIGDIIE